RDRGFLCFSPLIMLTDSQIEALRRQLTTDKERLLRNAQRAIDFSMDRDRDRIGRDSMDESVEEWMYGTELRLHDREKFLLSKIDEALERLDAGRIDQCENCEEPIGFARLQARPVTTLCIVCKEESEESEAAE
ncbi:MAG TPA: TraR/DksA C4-type zinc finger protein, partial [Candidatus Acidoferrum sp.]|nr:TraR/DksA C4-type zinc finger protein [Candidatus Acidoferrum sp.]